MNAQSKLPSTEGSSTPDWDITTVCDIRLGELFAANPDLQDKYIDINVDALQRSLTSINPNASGKLLFNACHDYALNDEGAKDQLKYGNTLRNTRVKQLLSRARNKDEIRVNVAIGGSKQSFPSDLHSYFRRYYTDGLYKEEESATKALLDNRKTRHKLFKIVDPFMDMASIAKIMGSTKEEDAIHHIVVHELSHVADSAEQRKEDAQAVKKHYRRTIYAPVFGAYSLMVGTTYAAENVYDTADSATYAIQAAFFIGTAIATRGRRATMQEFIRAERPTEIRAYEAEKRAADYPMVITFKDR